MRATFIAMLVLLLPAAVLANPTMGIDFGGGHYFYTPTAFVAFDAYVVANNAQCYIDASEFEVCYPAGIIQTGFDVPAGSLNLGDPDTGVSITYWPPMDGWNPGWNLLCTLHLMAIVPCDQQTDAHISIYPHHETGLDQVSCWPDNNLICLDPLTSIICPSQIAVQSKSWGSIKSLF
ncbi:MAG: hypothetical protein ABR899_02745 [Candidatus Krumholzibacteriaceae bacterium]